MDQGNKADKNCWEKKKKNSLSVIKFEFNFKTSYF